ncbi:AraC family transcriptional regulator [Actinoplanes lobatus]|uniref:AraC family transcriptional regulator n=1 Tax=Actinoplanes lobatus TaxID=113568 RepID=A0A7W7MIP6_9ACTN|nr:AraC family transcriptional regulator [Actinoplanes lobatus]MBB4751200.1 AraC-like DNA-binding protein [Actinoplanes lobatus]GGN95778.1 AraC family transcriptional regulator [Actinoplanes lobatus]GIE44267.1 AraC family transcriptional regulator [Actinoplanes lobatus]
MHRPAYSFVRSFPATPASDFQVDRHYLLCASTGALRLEAEGATWLLPPARAALITAGRPIRISIPQPVTTSSVLFDTTFVPPPPAPLTVFDLTPLARALVAECGLCATEDQPPSRYAESVLDALAAVTWKLAEQPSPVVVPTGRSPELRRALHLTEQRLAEQLTFEELAAEVGLAPRSLARRFEDECGMTWRATLRRMRILRAIEELAAGDTPVTKIAYTVGYTSLSAFNSAFRQLTTRSPTEYRASFRP